MTEPRQTPYDWGDLIRWGTDNWDLHPPAAGDNRVVSFGDQVTDVGYRGSADSFAGQTRLNPGIAGQVTDQVLIRFRRDVIDHYNKVAVILVGANDIAGFDRTSTEEMILDNLMSMSGIAPVTAFHMVLVSGTPVCSCYTKSTAFQRWQERIPEVNELIQKHCAGGGAVDLEYESAMADGNNLKQERTSGSVLPNNAWYRVMALGRADAGGDGPLAFVHFAKTSPRNFSQR